MDRWSVLTRSSNNTCASIQTTTSTIRRPSQNLSKKNLGPYEMIGNPGTHSVALHLPCQFCSVHPVFHVSQLDPARPNQFHLCQQPPPLPLQIDGELEYKVSEILDSK